MRFRLITWLIWPLASDAELQLSEEQKRALKEITSFNIEARYNSFKREFYKKVTREFTKKWFRKAKEIYSWVKEML